MVSAEIKLLHAADSGQLDVVKSLIAGEYKINKNRCVFIYFIFNIIFQKEE